MRTQTRGSWCGAVRMSNVSLFVLLSCLAGLQSTSGAEGTRLALMSDIHWGPMTLTNQTVYRAHLDQAIAAINAADVRLVLVAGDVTEKGNSGDLAEVRKQLQKLRAPFLCVPGNHDVGNKILPGKRATTKNDVSFARIKQYESVFGPATFVREEGGLRVIGINSSLFGSGLPEERAQWELLESELAGPAAKPSLLLCHFPLFVAGEDEPGGGYWNIEPEPRARLIRLLKRGGIKTVLSGHKHAPITHQVDGISYITTPPVSFGLPRAKQPEGWTLVEMSPQGEARYEIKLIGPADGAAGEGQTTWEHERTSATAASTPHGECDLPLPSAVLMPRAEDYTHMWWAEGFPGHMKGASWLRVIQTGRYAMALETETLQIPHFGAVRGAASYAAAALDDNRAWRALPPAELVLTLTVNGKTYRCANGGKWSTFGGPRLIESGRFLQRADVTGLVFAASDGTRLNAEARLETVAWPDRLALILAARPGQLPIPAGEACFGRAGGGFGLDGTNHLEIPDSPGLDPERFTLELWAFVPTDYQASERSSPWLVCKNGHEEAQGNYGIVIQRGAPQARMNIGGGRENMFVVADRAGLKVERWNHLAISYDGDSMRLYVNGEFAGKRDIGRRRVAGHGGLAFGRRQDNCGDGYHFRGAVDEIRLYHRALTHAEIRNRFLRPEAVDHTLEPAREWRFRADGMASPTKWGERWNSAAMEIALATPKHTLRQQWDLPAGRSWHSPDWREVSVFFDPVTFQADGPTGAVNIRAEEMPGGMARPVDYDPARGWYRVNLDGIEPIVPPGGEEKKNDAIERVSLVLSNPTGFERVARLLFEKSDGGFRQRIGASITGMSAILRGTDGQPTGIPVQLSKNWHGRPEGGVYAGQWFHGLSQVRLPPESRIDLELTLAYGHWGGVAAASHAQLCLIGWGCNQLWDQSALGSWGESICYEPDQAQAQCSILDVRPVMVRSSANDRPWSWTHNVGGGDFFRVFDGAGQRVFPARMRTAYERYGPCLTDVTYAGETGGAIEHAATVSLARTDDIVRGTYRLRLDVKNAMDISRFVIFQIGADTYSYTGERKMALGNETGLIREWDTRWGEGVYRTEPRECGGRVPWVSMHEAVRRASAGAHGAWANRGIVIRSWDACLGGRKVAPWVAERGVKARGEETSTMDILPPPGIGRLEPGDFVHAVIEHIIMPQFAADYYGPNEALRKALGEGKNTWRMIHREAVGNDRRVEMKIGTLEGLYPEVRVRTEGDGAAGNLVGGLGFVPITFTGLTSSRGYALEINGRRLDQAVHGNDFWQTDYDPGTGTWQMTFNVPVAATGASSFRFTKESVGPR
ncbi:MAG TPA: metallophosphoesterase [Verrucomicrobiae bacterium]|nr:metallophosphoesterase [Verrucomicrobiae bacterium]